MEHNNLDSPKIDPQNVSPQSQGARSRSFSLSKMTMLLYILVS